jgi:hypothetical protein
MDKKIVIPDLQINKNSGFFVNGGQYGAFLTTSMGGDYRLAGTIACSGRTPTSIGGYILKGIVPQD